MDLLILNALIQLILRRQHSVHIHVPHVAKLPLITAKMHLHVTNPFNCAALTTSQCKTPSSQTQLAKYCPATCGLCTVGSCTDLINCTGMSGACFVSSTQTFMCQQCAKTCGCPTTCSSTGTPSGTPTSTCGTDNTR
uniref:ShKT domain-containing protein n=1 Tax=Acrobeloides nanus TaxID=290746 RepID=A0A914CG64_9BILA